MTFEDNNPVFYIRTHAFAQMITIATTKCGKPHSYEFRTPYALSCMLAKYSWSRYKIIEKLVYCASIILSVINTVLSWRAI